MTTLTGAGGGTIGHRPVSKAERGGATEDPEVTPEGRIVAIGDRTARDWKKIWERALHDDHNLALLLSFGLRRRSNCLDVGANKGLFLREIRRVAPAGHHVAYEPLPNLYQQLVRAYPEMDIRQLALSDHDGTSNFVHVTDPDYDGYSGFQEQAYPVEVPTATIEVSTERLDDHLPRGWLPDFVKIDVEGAESLVIAGAMDTFRRARPVMSIEHGWGGGESFGFSDEEFYRVICHDIGLRLFNMDGEGPFDREQFLDMLHTVDHWNWIAHD